MIETTLTLQQAKVLFEKEAIPIKTVGHEIVSLLPVYRVIEFFGVDIGRWVEANIGLQPDTGKVGCLSSNTPSSFIDGKHLIFVDMNGLFEIVAEHNSRIVHMQEQESEAGKQWSMIWEARRARLKSIDDEEERKREERRAKRAAARKKKQESEATA